MARLTRRSALGAAAGALILGQTASAQEAPPAAVKPTEIWQAGLEKLAGRYLFVQIASPGGLWERGKENRQVSLSQLSPAARNRLMKAEIVISDLKLPSTIEASQRLSPSKRGNLRFYSETAQGRLLLQNLPGISGGEDLEKFDGPVEFHIGHQSHSNPSVNGILTQRMQQEQTWGVATLDYADFTASRPRKEDKPDEEESPVMTNARILRSGVEIFAFVEWEEMFDGEPRRYNGSVRLLKQTARQAPPAPGAPGKPAPTDEALT